VKVTNVVDNQTKRKRTSICLVGERSFYRLVVVAVEVSSTILGQKGSKILDGVKNFVSVGNEGEVIEGATLIEVGLIDEVPI
jgi:hypothetical protein